MRGCLSLSTSLICVSFLSFLITAPCLGSTVSNPQHVEKQTIKYWEEEIPPPLVVDEIDQDQDEPTADRRRSIFWKPPKQEAHQQQKSPRRRKRKPHPLRTNLWKIDFTSRNRHYFSNQTLIIDFDDTEQDFKFLKVKHHEEETIGKWHMIPSGILWRYHDSNNNNVKLHFTAEIHLNPFGDHPRMLRGVVVRDR